MNRIDVIGQLRQFVSDRDWAQFHTSENLAKSITIEAAELLELFQWDSKVDVSRLRDELADVLTYCFLLADKHDLVPEAIVIEKLQATKEKYPIEKSRGRSTKYDQL